MANEQEIIVAADEAGQRLDQWLAAHLAGVSRTKAQRLVDGGAVLVDGKPARTKDKLAAGARVTVSAAAAAEAAAKRHEALGPLEPVAMPLVVLFEDDDIIIVDKPAGISVHPGAGDRGPTLVQGVLHHCRGRLAGTGDPLAEHRPGIVHRLDKDTSGVLVCAKTDMAHAALSKQFHDKTNDREYGALVDGAFTQQEHMVESYLSRDPSNRLRFTSKPYPAGGPTTGLPKGQRYAKTLFRREEAFHERVTLAGVRLYTGRTHQIRVHAQVIGLPVLGDQLYRQGAIARQLPKTFPAAATTAIRALTRQMLHARLLGITHPRTAARLRFSSPYPADFQAVLEILRASVPNPRVGD